MEIKIKEVKKLTPAKFILNLLINESIFNKEYVIEYSINTINNIYSNITDNYVYEELYDRIDDADLRDFIKTIGFDTYDDIDNIIEYLKKEYDDYKYDQEACLRTQQLLDHYLKKNNNFIY